MGGSVEGSVKIQLKTPFNPLLVYQINRHL